MAALICILTAFSVVPQNFLILRCCLSHYHIAQTLTVTELSEHQSKKLVPAGEMLDITVTVIFASEIIEVIPIKK